MIRAPLTVEAFDELVPDDDAAEAILVRSRWPDGVSCPRCGSRDMRRLSNRKLWQCGACRRQTSIRAGTVMHRSKLRLRDWLFAVWKISSSPTSANALARQLDLRYDTAWLAAHKIRAACAERGAWQLEDVFALDIAEIPVPRAANGDPEERPPVEVAMVVDPSPRPADAIRFEVACPGVAPARPLLEALAAQAADEPMQTPPGEALLAEARHHHLHPRATALVGMREIVAAARRRVVDWLTHRFGGVSRRYLNNYLAQFAYVENRTHRAVDLFVHMVRRVTHEAWRPRSELTLIAP